MNRASILILVVGVAIGMLVMRFGLQSSATSPDAARLAESIRNGMTMDQCVLLLGEPEARVPRERDL